MLSWILPVCGCLCLHPIAPSSLEHLCLSSSGALLSQEEELSLVLLPRLAAVSDVVPTG